MQQLLAAATASCGIVIHPFVLLTCPVDAACNATFAYAALLWLLVMVMANL
jgi:hypothetical protein